MNYSYSYNINSKIFQHFESLSSLKLKFSHSAGQASVEFFESIFDFNQSIQHLTLLLNRPYNDKIHTLITKLSKLESLELDTVTDGFVNALGELNYLKSLTIRCSNRSCNSLLRKLSDIGIIEYLQISSNSNGNENEYDNMPPIMFKKLKTLIIDGSWMTSSLFKLIPKMRMPEISSLEFNLLFPKFDENAEHLQLDILKSNKTLNTFKPVYNTTNITFEFVSQRIDILKEPCTPNRPILNLKICSFLSGMGQDRGREDVVRKMKCYC